MHNSEIKNLEFEIQFATTNLRYLAGAENPDIERINKGKEIIEELEEKLSNLKIDSVIRGITFE